MYNCPKGYEQYATLFNKPLSKSELIRYFVGQDKTHRLTNRDSLMSDISDLEFILEYCLYPTFLQGKKDIKELVQEALVDMSVSNDPIQVYQALLFLNSQKMMLNYYETVPFTVNPEPILTNIKTALSNTDLKNKMKTYQVGEFACYQDSMFDMLERVLLTF
ncbi:MAG: NAD glycohydrolase inhibitor [Streptococcus dysgalactiae]|nr:NAD glycohydrolase inhibitor [Streptococcus dysgalactiae]